MNPGDTAFSAANCFPRAFLGDKRYGTEHKAIRRILSPVIASGNAICDICGEAIDPADAWDLGHARDRAHYAGPQHAECNRREGALSRYRKVSRSW